MSDIHADPATMSEIHADGRHIYNGVNFVASCATATIAAAIVHAMTTLPVLVAALEGMVYETTHLSPCEPDGAHKATISGKALEAARTALARARGEG